MKVKKFFKTLSVCLLTALSCVAFFTACGVADLESGEGKCAHAWRDWTITTEPTCEADGARTRECLFCGKVQEKSIAAFGHTWGEPIVTWTETDEGYEATASFVCETDESHVENVEGAVKSKKTDYTCTEDGSIVYEAEFEFEYTDYTDEKTVVLPAKHDYLPDYYASEAGHWFKCACGAASETVEHVHTEPVTENVVGVSCGGAGSYDEVVYCSDCGFEMSRENKTVDAIPHVYGAPTFAWTATSDGYTVTATFVCEANSEHVKTENAAVTFVKTDYTCYEEGSIDYTAKISLGGKEYTDQKTDILPIVHTYGEYISNENGHWTECECGDKTAVLPHVEDAVKTENVVGVTCGGAGSYDEVVYCSDCDFEMSRENKTVDAIPHVYGAPAFAWTETSDGYVVTATFTCTANSEHVKTESTTVTSVKTDYTCYEEGSIVYTAKLTFEGTEYTDGKTVVLPIVHEYTEELHSSAAGHWTECECGAKTAIVTHAPQEAKQENQIAPTCGAEGSYDDVVYCDDCNFEISRTQKSVAKLPHVYGEPTFAWTETASGYTATITFVCTDDETHVKTENATVTSVKTDYTCYEEGSIVYTAKLTFEGTEYTDGKTVVLPIVHEYTEELHSSAAGHWTECECGAKTAIVTHAPLEAKQENQIAPTCGAEGSYDDVVYCDDCNFEISRTQKSVAKLPHVYGEPTFAWTETASGYTATITFVCTDDETHVEVQNAVVASVKTDYTCDEDGSIVYTATYLASGAEYTDEKTVVLPAAHRYATTYEKNGSGHWHKCDCGATTEIVVHAEAKPVTENELKATCGTAGSFETVVYCGDCEFEISRVKTDVAATGEHTEDTPVKEKIVASTCTTVGTYELVTYCSGCGGEMVRVKCEEPLKAHDCTETVLVAGSCTAEGKKFLECKDCDYEEEKAVPAVGHAYVNRICSECARVKESEGLAFTQSGNAYTLSGMGECTDTLVAIPAYVDGIPVTKIAASAFEKNTNIVELYFSELVTTIDTKAFFGCTSLRKVVFSDALISIGTYAFSGCQSLQEIIIPDSVQTIGQAAFGNCYAATKIIIGEGVTYLGLYAFTNARNVTYVEFNAINCADNTSSSYPDFFRRAGSQSGGFDVVVGDKVTRIPSRLFWYADSCTSEEDVLATTLIKSVTLPESGSLTSIGDYSFSCRYVGYVGIYVPASVTSVGDSAFQTRIGWYYSSGENYGQEYLFDSNLIVMFETAKRSYGDWWNQNAHVSIKLTNSHQTGTWYTHFMKYVFNATKTFGHTDGLDWVLLQDDTIAILGGDKDLTAAIIPEKLNGKPVSTIAAGAFQEHWNIKKAVIPQYVTSIGSAAFSFCPELKEVEYRATEVKGTENNSSVFSNMLSTTGIKFTIGANVKVLPTRVIGYNTDLTSEIVFEEGSRLEEIASNALSIKLDYFILPASLKKVDYDAFHGSISKFFYEGTREDLAHVEIDDSNTRLTRGNVYWLTEEAPAYDGYYWRYENGVPTIVHFVPDENNYTSAGLSYSLSADGTYYLVAGLGGCEDTEIIVPAIFNGKPVKGVGASAFRDQTQLTNFVLPTGMVFIDYYSFTDTGFYQNAENWVDGVLYIGEYLVGVDPTALPETYSVKAGTTLVAKSAFYDCDVVHLTLPDGLKYINDSAFYCCGYMQTLDLPDSIEVIGVGAFDSCGSLTGTIEIPAGTTEIGDGTFRNCYKLEGVVIPDSVTAIGDEAFYNCKALKELNLPSNLRTIGRDAFYYCMSIKTIELPSSLYTSAYYSGLFKGWYSLEEMTLAHIGNYPGTSGDVTSYYDNLGRLFDGTSYSVPEGFPLTIDVKQLYSSSSTSTKYYNIPGNLRKVTLTGEQYLSGGAFYNCSFLEEIVLNEGIVAIGNKAFYNCSGIKTITLPSTVEKIYTDAFYGCVKLIEVQNLSAHLELEEGSTDNGCIAFYAANVYGADGTSGYAVTADGYEYVVGSKKTMLIGYLGEATDLTLPATLGGNAYEIGAATFKNRTDLTSIVVPNTVVAIGAEAFYGCENMTGTITVPLTQTEIYPYTFYQCKSLTNVILHDDIETIHEYAFQKCESLREIIIPEALTTLSAYAFQNCVSVTKVYFNATAAYDSYSVHYVFSALGKNGAGVTVEVATNVTIIPDYYFYNTNVVQVNFAENSACVEIGGYAFSQTKLTEIKLPDGVTTIGSSAFSKCTELKVVELPATVTSIQYETFSGCTSIEKMTLPFVGYDATSTGEYGLFGYIFGTTSVSGLTATTQYYSGSYKYSRSYYIPKTIKEVTVLGGTLRYGAFYGCNFLETVVIPQDITEIAAYAFYNAGALKGFTVPENVTSIGNYAFYLCGSEEFTIPASVESIGNYAFYGSKFKSLTIEGTPTFGTYAFRESNVLSDVYYDGTLEEWMSLEFANVYANPLYHGANLWVNGEMIDELVIPETVTDIKAFTFAGSLGIRSVKLHENVASIGTNAFYRCEKITEVYNASSLDIALGQDTHGYVAYYATYLYDSLTAESPIMRTQDGFYYTHDESTGVYSLVDYDGGEKEITLPTNIEGDTYIVAANAFTGVPVTAVTVTEGAIELCDRAFYNCKTLKKIVIGDCVERIGAECFYGVGPEEMVLPFIGETMKTPDDTYQRPLGYIFAHTQPDSYDYEYDYVYTQQPHFQSSSSSTTHAVYYLPYTLKKLTVNGGHLLHGALAGKFGDFELILGDNVQSIRKYSAWISTSSTTYKGISALHIGDGITEIGTETFSNQTELKTITGGKNVTAIWDKAFSGCSSLVSAQFGDKLETVGFAAFYQCWSLQEFKAANVKTIGKQAFSDCASLTNFDEFASATSIGEQAFYGCDGFTEITIGSKADVTFGAKAMAYCGNLKTVVFGEYATAVTGEYTFSDCAKLELVKLGNSVKSVSAHAFYYCTALAIVVIGENVETIGTEAFYFCEKLKTVYNLSPHITVTNSSANGHIGAYLPTVYTSLDEGPLAPSQE